MRAAEVAETALSMRNVSSDAEDTWTTFEVIENGELGRQEASGPGPVFSSILPVMLPVFKHSQHDWILSLILAISDVFFFFFHQSLF